MFVHGCQPQEILHLLFRRGKTQMIVKVYDIFERYMQLEQQQLIAERRHAGRQMLLNGHLQRPTLAVTPSGVVFPQH